MNKTIERWLGLQARPNRDNTAEIGLYEIQAERLRTQKGELDAAGADLKTRLDTHLGELARHAGMEAINVRGLHDGDAPKLYREAATRAVLGFMAELQAKADRTLLLEGNPASDEAAAPEKLSA
jgi:hypothetical protein